MKRVNRSVRVCSWLIAVSLGVACGKPGPVDAGVTVVEREPSGLTACQITEKGYYYIGLSTPLTGNVGSLGAQINYGTQQAIADINAAGGIKGKKLGLISCDSKADDTTAGLVATELAGVSPMPAIVGPSLTIEVFASVDALVAAKKVAISPLSSAGAFTSLADDGYFFRTSAAGTVEGTQLANMAHLRGFRKAYVPTRADASGATARDAFMTTFKAKPGAQAETISMPLGLNDVEVGELVNAAIAYAPDVVYLISSDVQAAQFVRAAISKNFHPQWYHSNSNATATFITSVNNNSYLEGSLTLTPYQGPLWSTFAAKFQTLWGLAPNYNGGAAYDATMLLAIAMSLATNPDDGTSVRDALASTHSGTKVNAGDWAAAIGQVSAGKMDYVGVTGPVDFDAAGDIKALESEYIVRDGKFVIGACLTLEGTPCP